MINSESGMVKKNMAVRFLAFSLAAIMMLGAFAVVPVLSVESEPEAEQSQSAQNNSDIKYEQDVLSITVDGEEITELEVYENEKVTIKAEGVLAAKYQWQILHPEKSGLWIDIYEETKETLDVSLALTGNMEQEDGKTYLRCLAYEADGAYVTDVLSVTILEGSKPIDAHEIPKLKAEKVDTHNVYADDDDHPEFVTVTIQYEKYGYFYNVNTAKYELQYIAPAFSSYIATLQYGKQFKPVDPISVPTVVGYKPIFEGIDGITMVDEKIYANIASVTSDITLEVRYVPDTVEYEVRYLFQNIYDDMYVTNTGIDDDERGIVDGIYHGEGITGLPPSYKVDADGNPYENNEKIGISAEFNGFTALYYQPDTIAADGSTVFEVYFERNYYLMEFDCDGGYGAHTVYARHGTYIYVPTPAKMGYVLKKDANGNYWDLVKTENPEWAGYSEAQLEALLGAKIYEDGVFTGFYEGNDVPDALPAEMPTYNTSYKALWDTTDTTYTVVYWIDNGDGTQTYIGSHPEDARSATLVSGGPDLSATMDLCGLEEHTHGTGCKYNCGLTEHKHSADCCTIPPHTHGATCCSIFEHTHNHNECCTKTLHTHDGSCCTIVNHTTHTAITCFTNQVGDYELVGTSGDHYNRVRNINNPNAATVYKYRVRNYSNNYTYYNYYYDGSNWYYLGTGQDYAGIVVYIGTTGSWNNNYKSSKVVSTICEHTHGDGTCNIENCSNGGIEHTATDGTCNTNKCPNGGNEHTHGIGCNTENCNKIEHSSNHNDGKCVYCSTPEHNHKTNGCVLSCGQEAHTHSNSCKVSDAAHYEFVDADGYGDKPDIMVDGDGSTVINVYYKKKLYEIRYLYARKSSGGQYQIANSTGGGRVGTDWSTVNVSSIPTIKEGLNYTQKEEIIGNYTYYYIAVRAEYDANIESMWPSNAFEKIGNYSFGSWGAEYGSGYRGKDPAHANIVGPYPYMSAEMVTAGNENLDPIYDEDTKEWYYVAQRMSAWWGGTSDNVGSHTYHIYYESLDGTGDRMYEGKWYKLDSTHTFTAAHNTNTRVDPFYYNGFKCVNDTREHGYDHQYDYQRNSSLYSKGSTQQDEEGHLLYNCPNNSCSYCNCFYYDRVDYQFALYNYNALLNLNQLNVSVESASWTDTPFGEELFDFVKDQCENKFDPTNNTIIQDDFYPKGIEPGAYEFGGWYTTPACYAGTEVNWNTITMPDGNLTLYAKWTPVMRNVYFHLLYTDINYDNIENSNFWYPDGISDAEKEDYYPIEVSHGELLGTTYSHTPTRVVNGEEYTFIGWFYFDENGKKKFAPDSMKVTRDLILFAEWFTTAVTTYKVEYMAYNYVDGGAGDTLIDAEIAPMLNDYSTAGKTITFNAKGGTAMYDKSGSGGRNYQSKWFPHTSSHSILMDEEADNNTFYFKYYNKDYINYKVVYVNRINGEILGESEVIPTENAIVTPKFKPFEGFIPEDYYIEHSVAFDPTDYTEHPNHVSDENIVYFYYVPDTEHALHRFEHHYQNLQDDGYTLYTAEQGPHKINEEKKAEVIRETGFQLVRIEVTTYDLVSGNWIPDTVTINVNDANREYYRNNGITEKVTLGGLDIRFYYDRIEYSYTVHYVEDVNNENVLVTNPRTDIIYKARYGATVSFTAHATYLNEGDAGDDGLLYIYQEGIDSTEEERTKTRQITEDEEKNTLIFVYAKKKLLVMYHTVTTVPDLESLNGISLSSEYASAYTELLGANAMAGKGFDFEGWFRDEACTVPVNPTWVIDGTLLKPLELVDNFDGVDDDTIHYYAKFEPQYGSLIVTKLRGDNNTPVEPNESFLFHIKGKNSNNKHIDMVITITNAGSKTINKIPIGDYEVTEMGDWSYTFISPTGGRAEDVVKNVTVEEDDTKTVEFDKYPQNSDWLTGEKIDDKE